MLRTRRGGSSVGVKVVAQAMAEARAARRGHGNICRGEAGQKGTGLKARRAQRALGPWGPVVVEDGATRQRLRGLCCETAEACNVTRTCYFKQSELI